MNVMQIKQDRSECIRSEDSSLCLVVDNAEFIVAVVVAVDSVRDDRNVLTAKSAFKNGDE